MGCHGNAQVVKGKYFSFILGKPVIVPEAINMPPTNAYRD